MTKWIYRLIALLTILLAFSAAAKAQSYERLSGWCEKGAETVTTDGRPSTTKVQRSYPSCTVTVYDAGTTNLSAIASAYAGTPKSNPFTSSTIGYWDFFGLDGRYDIVLTGGGLTSPVTLPGLWIRNAGGGGGSGITGSGTANRLPKFNTSTSINDSILQQIGTSEIKFTSTGKRLNLDTGSQEVIEIANDTVTGTTQDRLAILTGAPSKVVVAGTSNLGGLVGIVVAGSGITGNAQVAVQGVGNCEFDGSTVAGQYVIASPSLAGRCRNHGSTWPTTTGVQVIGRVLSTNGSAGTYAVMLFGQERRGQQTVGGSVTHVLWNNSGSIAGDSGFTYDTTLGLVTLGVSSGVTGQIQLKNINNAFTTTIQPGSTGSNLTFTLPSSLPASTSECLQISSAGVISRTGASCGSGGGSITGSGTINLIPLWTGGTTLSNSILQQVGTSEVKFTASGKRLNLDTGSQVVIEVTNDTTTGTTNDRLAKLTGAPSKVIVIGTADTTGIIGVVTANGGTSGAAEIITEGVGNCEFDAATTAGQYVIASTTLAGRCSATSTWPTSPIQVLGRVLSTNGAAGTYGVLWFGQERRGFQTIGGAVTNVLWNNSGSIAGDAGFTYDVSIATVTIGQGGVSNGLLSLRNATNSNNTTLQAGVPSSSLTFTLPATLPVSAGCLQVSSTGVITQTGSACAAGGGTPGGSGTELQYRGGASTFSAVTGSSVTTSGYVTLAPTASTSGSPTLLTVTGPAHTTLAADTEATDINFNLSRTVQFTAGGGSFTFQRAVRFQPPTYAFTSADTITAACTLCITGAPIAGTNATLTTRFSLWVESGMSNFDDIVNIGTGSSAASDDYLLFPFIGGSNSSGPAIRWGSSASYATQSSIFLSNGFTFQGANSTHDPIKFRAGTGTSSDGTVIFEFRPGDGTFNFTPSSSVTSSRHEMGVFDVTSTGTPAAGFGGQLVYKGESSTSNTQQMASWNWSWFDATHATRTSKAFVQTVLNGGSLTEVWSVQAAQNYGAAEFDNGSKSGAWTVDWNSGNNQKVTATGNFTTVTFSNIKAGARYTLRVVQDATGGRTWTPPTLFKMPGGVAGNVLTGTVGANDMFDCISSDGTNLYCNGLFDVKNP